MSISFLTLAMSQLWHVFNMRDGKVGFFHSDVTRNRFVWGALLLCLGLLAAAVYLPGLADVIEVRSPEPAGLLLAFLMSLVPCVIGFLAYAVRNRKADRMSSTD